MPIVRVHARVRGRVQGVGYRGFCSEIANELNITGCARNLYDGSVEVAAEGKEDNVNTFLQRIKDFEITWTDLDERGKLKRWTEKGVKSFEIVKTEKSKRRKYSGFLRR